MVHGISIQRKYIVDISACPESNRRSELPTILMEIDASHEPPSKTVSCGLCVGYVGWNVYSAWQTGWGAGKCIVGNCISEK